jgi:hypothetical protein
MTAILMLDSSTLTSSAIQIPSSRQLQGFHLTGFFLSPPSKEPQHFRLYYEFAKVTHFTGRPDVVNPYKFVDIFMSYHKKNVANECLYVHVVLPYCCVVVM